MQLFRSFITEKQCYVFPKYSGVKTGNTWCCYNASLINFTFVNTFMSPNFQTGQMWKFLLGYS